MKEDLVCHPWHLENPPAGSGVWLSMMGHYRNGFGACRRAGVYDVCCPHFILSGKGIYKTSAGESAFGPGDAFTLWPGIPFEFWETPGDDPLSFYWLWITGKGVEDFGHACGFSPDRLMISPKKSDTAAIILDRLLAIYEKRPSGSPCEVLALMYGLAAACADEKCSASKNPRSGAGLIMKAQATVESMLSTAVNVDSLARSLDVSRNTLLLGFKKGLGISPGEYIQARRIARAKELLRRTELPLSKIARAAGFANDKYLMRVFKKTENLSPGAWRIKKRDSN